MQRVSALLPSWDRSAGSGKFKWGEKIASPNTKRLSGSRLAKEALQPLTLDKECEKAARILKSFCLDGCLAPEDRPGTPSTTSSSGTSSRALKKIPPTIIQNAVGLAVFTSMRSGLWMSGSGGSGVLIARKADGTWSQPSGLLLQASGLGFVWSVDVYDCVVVINTYALLEAFGRPKVTLGTDVRLAGGPLVPMGLLENEVKWPDLSDMVVTYAKAKGQSADFKLDGTVLSARTDENERFYGSIYSVPKILAGDVNLSLPQVRPLTEMLKAAEGRTDYDAALVEQLAAQAAPGDATVDSPKSGTFPTPLFGIPDIDDPDPYGVFALEQAGLEIREAGTRLRPDSTIFEYSPSPSSSTFPRFKRTSVDTYMSRSNRGSYTSSKTMATERSHMTDAWTQTDQVVNTPETTPSPGRSDDGHPQPLKHIIPEVKEPEEVDYTKIDMSALRKLSAFPDLIDDSVTENPAQDETIIQSKEGEEDAPKSSNTSEIEPTVSREAINEADSDADDEEEEEEDDGNAADESEGDDDDDDEDFEDAEEPVVFEVATVQPPRVAIVAAQAVKVKGAMVNIPAKAPPPLPLRSPARLSRRSQSEFGDVSSLASPQRPDSSSSLQVEDDTTPKAGEEQLVTPTLDVPSITIDEHHQDETSDSEETPASPSTSKKGVEDTTNSQTEDSTSVTTTSPTSPEDEAKTSNQPAPISVA